MDPNLWGPSAWYFLHSITYNYPIKPTKQEKESVIHFFESLKHLLPCTICKVHYDKYIASNNIRNNVDSRESLIKWLIDIHNEVNKNTGKPMVSYESVLLSRPPQYCSLFQNCIFIIMLCIVIIFIKYFKIDD